jgi:DNA-binding transcriptional MerR regulator
VAELPNKDFYKLSEVCQYTDTQPYVLRFWESEFPQLDPGARGGGSRLYSRADVDLIRRIKQLLYEEEYTLAGAREKLEEESRPARSRRAVPADPAPVAEPPVAAAPRSPSEPPAPVLPFGSAEADVVARERYQDAIDEIDHLRLQVKDAENRCRRAEAAVVEAHGELERERERAARAAEILERLIERLS